MVTTVQIDLMTADKKLKADARAIATSEANGLKSAGFVGEGGHLLQVVAEKISAATVVGKIRKAGLPKAKLVRVDPQI